ncbi:exodeoxyribonuclease V subunit gamma [Caviibacterium pharyngocola]|uniref:RecBCD enzyme subunit RecC n=1 Tax=Caviibacterium pharyngocola TaxID=28159 RepID=A0A2M8RX54_9PAST|nr:exodeoxyribonuclease V subunit gamma [Caviibacterium pharyngocola]PJG83468.1 exodeoxyribonuclease V subunit gamma [Caviibacterium pharyngocola]
MFTVYYSNQLEVQKDILIHLMESEPLSDPFQAETILVQSPGMAQWLQWQIAETKGIAANLNFPMPASFIWQVYAENLPNATQQHYFDKAEITWRLMRLIPAYLSQEAFLPLRRYLASSTQSEQQKLYQLARKIADLFDQYLVYRPEWIMHWENRQDIEIERQIGAQISQDKDQPFEQICTHIRWQGALWQGLVNEIRQESQSGQVWHRAYLHQQFLRQLEREAPKAIPKRLFIFGISALPKVYLDTFQALSRYCDVHLFFNNGCREYWGDIIDQSYWQTLQIRSRRDYFTQIDSPLFSTEKSASLARQETERTYDDELLQIGHPLLASWGKLGRDFLYLLTDLQAKEISAYTQPSERHLLAQLQGRILDLVPNGAKPLNLQKNDRSLSVHSCYSAMREVEVLRDYLLHLFNQDKTLDPKDVVIMVADIDSYTPYIRAVFNQSEPYIPYSISDNKLSESDVVISAFLTLLNLKESLFTAEEVLAFLDIPAVRARFQIEHKDLAYIHHWVAQSGIRFGLEKYQQNAEHNYNAWQAGLERMLLGYAMREENGIWQDSLGFDDSHGLQGQSVGCLADFIEHLYQWRQILLSPRSVQQWTQQLSLLLDNFFADDEQNRETLWYLKDRIQSVLEQAVNVHFDELLTIEVICDVMTEALQNDTNSLKFLAGKVNFCTLLPMRSIPFKAVCLLGMNENDYPRQHIPNSFDLMQYHHRKGDRFRRDDDRYLFLEALLSAQDYFYISYVGRSVVDDQACQPSVLVSQLLDYLNENIAPNEDDNDDRLSLRDKLVKQHSMTVFSPKNFVGNDRTFAKNWLPLAQGSNKKEEPNSDGGLPSFIQPLTAPQLDEIELARLIEFVQHPIKFFFERRLGVYLKQYIDSIEESENFSLNKLDFYFINNELIHYSAQQTDEFFARLNQRGVMPRGSFAQVYARLIQEDINELKTKLADYLSREAKTEYAEISFETAGKPIRLQGDINQLYTTANGALQRVAWRVGSDVRDNELIESWIYYLVQCATSENVVTPMFYAKKNTLTFKTLDKKTALKQLQTYVNAYAQGQSIMLPTVTRGIADYLQTLKVDLAESAVDFDSYFEKFTELAQGTDYTAGDVYWRRLLVQLPPQVFASVLTEINQRMQDWFDLMLDCVEYEEN